MAQPTETQLSRRQHSQLRLADDVAWAQGDFAVHPLALATPLIDGQAAMLAMCVAFLRAQDDLAGGLEHVCAVETGAWARSVRGARWL